MKRMMILALSLLMSGALLGPLSSAAEEKPASGGDPAFTLYQFKGSAKSLSTLDKKIQADERFKQLGCEKITSPRDKRAPKYFCKQNDATTQSLFSGGVQSGVELNSTLGVCPTGCLYTRCPPPSGPYKCCNTTTWQPCI